MHIVNSPEVAISNSNFSSSNNFHITIENTDIVTLTSVTIDGENGVP